MIEVRQRFDILDTVPDLFCLCAFNQSLGNLVGELIFLGSALLIGAMVYILFNFILGGRELNAAIRLIRNR